MKTIVCENPGHLTLNETPKPEWREDYAIVRIRRIGICGTDLHAYRGRQPFFTYPRILGHELSGVIEEIGDNAAGLAAGDPVTFIPYVHCGTCRACQSGKTNCCTQMSVLGVHADGGMREWMEVPVDCLIKADGLSPESAAIVECLSIGAHAVRRAQPQRNERVLVIGAGPIGLGVMKYARLSGADVTAMDMLEDRLTFCREWAGVQRTVTGGEDAEEKLRQALDGELPDVVFDATGNQASMEAAFRLAAHGGRLVYVGLVKTDITFDDPLFHSRELTLMASRNATREDFQTVMRSMREGHVDTETFVTHRASLDDTVGKFEEWLDPASQVIKAMVAVD